MPLRAPGALSMAVIGIGSRDKCERLSAFLDEFFTFWTRKGEHASAELLRALPALIRREVYAPCLTADFPYVLLVSLLLASEALLRNC